jgi:hypothetical protein
MKSFIIYVSGVLTPFAILLVCSLLGELADWRARRRYKRAWDKFSAEFDTLTPQHLAACRARWDAEPYNYERYHSDRARYFAMRWQYGNTTEV